MNFDREESKFEKKICLCVCGGGGGGGGGRALTSKWYVKLCQLRSNTEIQLSTQCRACGKINISKSQKTLILSSLVSEF